MFESQPLKKLVFMSKSEEGWLNQSKIKALINANSFLLHNTSLWYNLHPSGPVSLTA